MHLPCQSFGRGGEGAKMNAPRRFAVEGEWWRDFSDLLDLATQADGDVVLLSAYFDASERDGGVFSVGGFAFGVDRAKKACRQWHRLWGGTQCHMTDLHTRMPGSAFAKWTPEQAGDRLKNSIEIINKYANYGIAISCNMGEIQRLAPIRAASSSEKYLDGFKSAYATCCHLAMASLARLIREHNSDSRVAYFFEVGDKNQAAAARFWDLAAASPLKDYYHHFSHTCIKKKDAQLLEMSDIFAWEWAKHQERIQEGRDMRPSLRAILAPERDGYSGPIDFASRSRCAIHLTGEPLERYFKRVKDEVLS